MKKTYRISVFNRTTGQRELMWNIYTSRKSAENMAEAMNKLDTNGTIGAKVVTAIDGKIQK